VDITVNRTQKTFYQVDSTLAALLLEAFPEAFERVERVVLAPRPTEPQWGLGITESGYARITLLLPSGETRSYDGPPETAKDGFKVLAWSGEAQARVLQGPEPPAEIIKQYTARHLPRQYQNGGAMEQFWNASRKR
jgi:hypothetical protein